MNFEPESPAHGQRKVHGQGSSGNKGHHHLEDPCH